SEDLGGGMKALYQMEWQVDMADGTGTATGGTNLSSRNQFVGISGGMGTVLLGRLDTPAKTVQGSFDQFVDRVADMNADGMVGGDVRANNAIAFVSPEMGGMQLKVAIVPGESSTAATGGADCASECDGIADANSISFTYKAGPLYVGVGLEGGDLVADQTRLVVTYKMDALSAGFLYHETSDIGTEDETNMGLSAAYALGDNAVKFQYISATDNAGVADADETTMTFGYDMKLSARTTAYALYRMFDEADVNNMGVGITHNF
ncbi:MAG: hypothetical protein QG652_1672, partial [Pseudomonadota bacterium]|nr:hypothetical protein [Pseudomonadota bacterium]